MWFPQRLRRSIERLGPYPSLVLVAVPLAIVEPLKLAIIFVAGSGHWVTGSIAMVCVYALDILVVERLFRIAKPKLLLIPWFAMIWEWFAATWDKGRGWLRAAARYLPSRHCRSQSLP
jgi:hypothetical protein